MKGTVQRMLTKNEQALDSQQIQEIYKNVLIVVRWSFPGLLSHPYNHNTINGLAFTNVGEIKSVG